LPAIRTFAIVPEFAGELSNLFQQIRIPVIPFAKAYALKRFPKLSRPLPWVDHEDEPSDGGEFGIFKDAIYDDGEWMCGCCVSSCAM
jgi:hypothetical protein